MTSPTSASPASALGVALVLSLLFLLLLRLVAGPLVLVLILGVLAVLAYGIYHCWKEYQLLRDRGASITQLGFTTNLGAYRSVQETWLVAREYPPSQRQLPKGRPGLTPACPRSDRAGRAGRPPAAHAPLPAPADPHRHRPPEGGQQVRGGRVAWAAGRVHCSAEGRTMQC